MTVLHGGDSATPKPDQYPGKKIWGVYVAGAASHIWTQEEVVELAQRGIEGVVPIVVPPQGEKWWEENFGYATLEALVREAIAWGVPEGSPLCLDVEEFQGAEMSAPSDVLHAWAVATRTHKMRTWTYGSPSFLAHDMWGFRWLAEWPTVTPENPELPAGFAAWQYKGNDNGIDLDIFEEGRDYLAPDLRVVVLPVPYEPPEQTEARGTEESQAPGAEAPETPTPDVETAEPSADSETVGDASPAVVTPPTTGSPPQAESEPALSVPYEFFCYLMDFPQLNELGALVAAKIAKELPKS